MSELFALFLVFVFVLLICLHTDNIGFGWYDFSDRNFKPPKPKWYQVINMYLVYDCRGGINQVYYQIYTLRIFWFIPLIHYKVRC